MTQKKPFRERLLELLAVNQIIGEEEQSLFAIACCLTVKDKKEQYPSMPQLFWDLAKEWCTTFAIGKLSFFIIYENQNASWWWLELAESDGYGTRVWHTEKLNKAFGFQAFRIEINPVKIFLYFEEVSSFFLDEQIAETFLSEFENRDFRFFSVDLWEKIINNHKLMKKRTFRLN